MLCNARTAHFLLLPSLPRSALVGEFDVEKDAAVDWAAVRVDPLPAMLHH